MRVILPLRRELVVHVGLSHAQREEYLHETNGLTEQFSEPGQWKSVLPRLLRLRLLCTKSVEKTAGRDVLPGSSSSSSCVPRRPASGESGGFEGAKLEESLEDLFLRSEKMRVR